MKLTLGGEVHTQKEQVVTSDTYDESPYESYPFAQTIAGNLRSIAYLFGLKAPELENARILELGCASGGNLIPQAALYPKAKFVGVDLSAEQTKAGNELIKKTGLKNIEIKTASITDIDKSYGEFDYIICHGVLSWVPEEVRESIFKVCSERLSPTGLAYISYNTLPGWNMVRSIRDMMLYHSKDFDNVEDKITQSALLLDFVKDSLEGTNSPYSEVLKSEAEVLAGQPRSYLRHDHMEETNFQYYFHEFMEEAAKNNMQYLGDATIGSMYIGNLPPKAIEKMQEIKDIVKSEQYMDFITNRRFRSTILCKNNIALNRTLDNETMKNLHFAGRITPLTEVSKVNFEDTSSLEFQSSMSPEAKMSTASPVMKAALCTLFENVDKLLSFDSLVDLTCKKLKGAKFKKEDVSMEISTNLLRLIFSGYISFSLDKFDNVKASDKPKAWDLSKAQTPMNNNLWVTNLLHERVKLNVLDAHILKHLDGKNDAEKVFTKIAEHVKKGDIVMNIDGKPISDMKLVEQDVKNYIKQSFESFRLNKLLVG